MAHGGSSLQTVIAYPQSAQRNSPFTWSPAAESWISSPPAAVVGSSRDALIPTSLVGNTW